MRARHLIMWLDKHDMLRHELAEALGISEERVERFCTTKKGLPRWLGYALDGIGTVTSIQSYEEITQLRALAIFLAGYQEEVHTLRSKCMSVSDAECKELVIMQFPIVQGTANQLKLLKISKLNYDKAEVALAVEYLLNNEKERTDV